MQAALPALVEENLISALHKCRVSKDVHQAQQLHAYLCRHDLELHPVLGNHLVPVLVECGNLPDARHIFDRLPYRNEHSCTSLLSGFIGCGDMQNAFRLYDTMEQQHGVQPNQYTYVALLNACARTNNRERGQQIHAETTWRGFERELHLGCALVVTYTKCGSLAEAQQVFDGLLGRDAALWNALIAGYAEKGFGEDVLKHYRQMQREGVAAGAVTFVCSLKACGVVGALKDGHELHAETTKRGMERQLHVGSTLVDMYAKHGLLAEAEQLFYQLPVRDTVSWNALLTGYIEHGFDGEALNFCKRMQVDGISPDSVTFVGSLKACGAAGDLEMGMGFHNEIIKRGMENELSVGGAVVDMYSKCSSAGEAYFVFAHFPVQNTVMWTLLIGGYASQGFDEEVLKCLKQMQVANVDVDAVTFLLCLRACGTLGAVEIGQEINAELTKRGLERELHVGSMLVHMYTKCKLLSEAHHVLDHLSGQDAVSWNALIVGYAEYGLNDNVLNCFKQMQLQGVSPDAVTFICSLKASSTVRAVQIGQELHTGIIKRGLERELHVGNMLVDMYAKCALPVEAHKVFEKLPFQDAVSWNSRIAGFPECRLNDVGNCFRQMQLEGVPMDGITCVLCLKACGCIEALETGREIHLEITKRGLERESYIGNTLVDMYGKCRSIAEAQRVFDRLSVRNAVSWTALVTGFAKQGLGEEVLNCFRQMVLEGVPADAAVFVVCLKACSDLGTIEAGQEIHAEIRRSGLEDHFISNILIDMYGKCGAVEEARKVFDKLPVHDVVSWTAMIKTYGENHEGIMAVKCFEEMLEQGVKPNSMTFSCLLAACSHASLLIQGQAFFKAMIKEHEIEPSMDHYACMVDLLARSGHVYEASRFIAAMQCTPSTAILLNLLSACKVYGEVEVGQTCFQQLVEVDEADASSYLMMADVYASAGRCMDAGRVKEMRKHVGANKKPGSAVIEVSKKLHEFVVGFELNQGISELLDILNSRLKTRDYIPNLELNILSKYHEEKESTNFKHSTKIYLCPTNSNGSIAFGNLARKCNDFTI